MNTFSSGNAISDFPDIIEVFSTNSSAHYRSLVDECFGRYVKIEEETSNGKPVWKHESNDRVLHLSTAGYWCFGTPTAPTAKNCGYIASGHTNKDLFNSGVWQYSDGNNTWHKDFTIIVKGSFTMKTICSLLSRLCISDSWEKGSSCWRRRPDRYHMQNN